MIILQGAVVSNLYAHFYKCCASDYHNFIYKHNIYIEMSKRKQFIRMTQEKVLDNGRRITARQNQECRSRKSAK